MLASSIYHVTVTVHISPPLDYCFVHPLIPVLCSVLVHLLLARLRQVTGSGINPLSPLYRNPTLQHIMQQSDRAPKEVRLSSTYMSHYLGRLDSEQFKSFSYARLELPLEAGSFRTPGSTQPVQAVILSGKQNDCTIHVANPDECQMTVWFFGEPKDTKHRSGLLGAAASMLDAVGSALDAALHRPIDFGKCVPIGKPVTVDVVDVANRGYFSRIPFGRGSEVSGFSISTSAYHYRPGANAVKQFCVQQPQQEHSGSSAASSSVAQQLPSGDNSILNDSPGSSTPSGVGSSAAAVDLAVSNHFAPLGGEPTSDSDDNSNSDTNSAPTGADTELLAASSSTTIAAAAVPSSSSWQGTDPLQLQGQLKEHLTQLQNSYASLIQAKNEAKEFTSVAAKPLSPEEIEQRNSRNILSDLEREQQQLRLSSHTQMLQQLVQLAAASSADVQQLLGACSSMLDTPYCRPQGAAAMQAAVQQLCQVLSSSSVPDLAVQLRTLDNEVSRHTSSG
jgi:hypothetical protein